MSNSVVNLISLNEYNYSNEKNILSNIQLALDGLDLSDEYFRENMNVLIKPNLVMDVNQNPVAGTECLYTQPIIIKGVIDYILNKTNSKVHIVVGDAPMQECNFDNFTQIKTMINEYRSTGIDIEFVDFRELHSKVIAGVHINEINKKAKGKIINLSKESEFYLSGVYSFEKVRITNYDPTILPRHHNNEIQEYYVSEYVLKADLIFNLPKPKSHRKAGVTIALKNFVGANTRKEFLPHHTMGSFEEGGDEYLHKSKLHKLYSSLLDKKNYCSAHGKYMASFFFHAFARICATPLKLKKDFYEGSWYGNNTISKTVTDINKIVMYADKNGIMKDYPQRKTIILADMIISGEKEGPVIPSPKAVGIIASGTNPVCFDETIATIMGFDYAKIPTIKLARETNSKYKLVDKDTKPYIISNNDKFNVGDLDLLKESNTLKFEASSGWKGHIEL